MHAIRTGIMAGILPQAELAGEFERARDQRADSGECALALTTVRQIDISRGRSDHRVLGGIIGGAISGGAFVAAACAFSDGSCDIGKHVGGFIAYYAVGAIPGVLIGRSIGSRHHGAERWEVRWATGSGR